jgi:hypothetical protein
LTTIAKPPWPPSTTADHHVDRQAIATHSAAVLIADFPPPVAMSAFLPLFPAQGVVVRRWRRLPQWVQG